jgi:Notch-like protein
MKNLFKVYWNQIRCYSYVGRRGGSQDVSLGPGCIYVGTVVHELMHAIGFYHEHMRSDRDSYLTIHFKNIEIGMKDQFTKVSPKYNHLYTRFDYDSIMIYSSTAFSKNGRHTMDPKQRGNKLVNPYDKNGLSSLDIINVKKMYNNEC